jgi:hypothetical protein
MSRTIWRFPIPAKSEFELELPQGARVVHVGCKDDAPDMWVLLDKDAEPELRGFLVLATGERVPDRSRDYLGTFFTDDGQLVWHLFDAGPHV